MNQPGDDRGTPRRSPLLGSSPLSRNNPLAPPGRSPFLRTSPALTAFLRLQDRRTSSGLGDFRQAGPIVPQRSKQSVRSLPRLWPSACWTAGCPPWWDVERPTGCPSDCLAAGSPAGSKKGRERRGSLHAPPLSRRALSAPCPSARPPAAPFAGRPERSGGAAAGRQRPLAASCRWRPPGLFLCPHTPAQLALAQRRGATSGWIKLWRLRGGGRARPSEF